MKTRSVIVAFIALFFLSACSEQEAWRPLLDEELSGWTLYQSYDFPKDYAGGKPPKDEFGNDIPPIGYNKNVGNAFFTEWLDGELVVHLTGETYGTLFTKESFSNYHLRLQYKFGTKKSGPRHNKALDSGLIYHSYGDPGADYSLSWKAGHEFQVLVGGTYDGNTGDYWNIGSTMVDIRATPGGEYNEYIYDPQGEKHTFGCMGAGWVCRTVDHAYAPDEWTTLDLICFEDKSIHLVNGEVSLVIENSRHWQGDQIVPLTQGQLQLQSEGGEVYYKEIKIRPIEQIPDEYQTYFD